MHYTQAEASIPLLGRGLQRAPATDRAKKIDEIVGPAQVRRFLWSATSVDEQLMKLLHGAASTPQMNISLPTSTTQLH